ncbi:MULTISPECIES: hypothetical protein [unclassified Streptomyces]|uniref:hypothetical protein n=1 Tax=unclassified Streptomyces TaxID=2593676 RepID=UPI00037961AF|nr:MULTISPECIES: hypothetical protein [unclassified Streptomyces]MYT28881.1 hypothetical protein [Streptomyces sp. SID8354]
MSSSSTVRTARRRTLRVAAAALTAAAALGLTACSGSDAAGAKPAGHPAAVAESSGAGSPAAVRGSESRADSGAKGVAKAGAAGKRSGGSHDAATKAAAPARTQTLPDGSKAEIYRLGAQHYRAKIVSRGAVLATLETQGTDAGLDANDMFVVLTLDGQVHAWMGGGHQGPRTFKVAGGWTVKVRKLGELHYRADIIGNDDSVDGTLETKGHDAGGVANGVYMVLSNGGVLSAHA